jgi:nucleotide-binding universal stress UspA family protein
MEQGAANSLAELGGEKHLVLAVAEPRVSRRAAIYLGAMIGGLPRFRVTVLHVVAEPPKTFFSGPEERDEWMGSQEAEGRELAELCRELLVQSGFEEDMVDTAVVVRDCTSLAECILDEVEKREACTVIIGRRGISPKEEYLYGSTSSRLLHSSKGCAVWVVE